MSKRKQIDISSYFGGAAINSKDVSTTEKPATAAAKVSKRVLHVSTAEKWKTTQLAVYNAEDWLLLLKGTDANEVKALKCSACTRYYTQISGVKGFSPQWSSDEGCTRLMLSSAIDHASSEPHKQAMILVMKQKGMNVLERSQAMQGVLDSQKQGSFLSALATLNEQDLERTKKKFQIAYYIAKEELPIAKFRTMLDLEERLGVDVGTSYRNNNSGGVFIDYISESIAEELKQKLAKVHFYSVLADGSTDSATSENEAVFVVHFDPDPPGCDRVKVVVSFLKLNFLQTAGATGIVESIKESFKAVSIDDLFHKLVGFGADGANVNKGNKEGVKAILRRENPWLNFGWCVAHRLELSLKDGLHGTVFDEIDEVILRMYYLYKKAPKKLRQLKLLVDIYGEGDEFETGGCRPKKASGTRWIAHKVAALDVILDKYGIYLQHLENISEDNSFPADDRAKCKGWLRKWSEVRIPLLIALFIEVLAPAKCLSKSFQAGDIDVVASIENVEKTKRQLHRISQKELKELPTVKRLLQKIQERDGKYLLHDVVIRGYERAVETIEKVKDDLVERVKNAIEQRLEEDPEDERGVMAALLNTSGWVKAKDDVVIFDQDVERLYKRYRIPLERACFSGTVGELLDQWHNILEYALAYLSPERVDYRVVWHQLFNCSRSKEWSAILILIELLFVLPVSNAKVEAFFSLMKRVKTDTRASLKEHRLNSLLRIVTEGPPTNEFIPTTAIDLWMKGACTARRPNQSYRSYKVREKKKIAETLIDVESDTSEEESDDYTL